MITHFIAVLVVCGLQSAATDAVPSTDTAVDAALRSAAIQMYDSFHENRPELDARWAALKQVEQAWRAAGCPAGDREKMLAWLENAREASQVTSSAPLPTTPAFTPVAKQHLASERKTIEKSADTTDSPHQQAGKSDKARATDDPKPAAKNEKTSADDAAKQPAAKATDKPAPNSAAKSAHGTSLVKFMRNVLTKLESNSDEPEAKPAQKPAGK